MSLLKTLAPSVIGGLFGLSSAKSTNKANQGIAEQANAFTREMMQSRHQWETADLRAAGLNPILSAGGTPSMGSPTSIPETGEVDAAVSGASSALATKRLSEELENIRADTSLKKDQAKAVIDNADSQRISAVAGATSANAQARLANVQAAQKGVFTSGYEAAGRIVDKAVGAGEKFINKFTSSSTKKTYGYGRGSR